MMCIRRDRYFSNIFPQRKSILLGSQTRLNEEQLRVLHSELFPFLKEKALDEGVVQICLLSQPGLGDGGWAAWRRKGAAAGAPGWLKHPCSTQNSPCPSPLTQGAKQDALSQSQQQLNPSASGVVSLRVSALCHDTVMGGSPSPDCPPPPSFSPR